MSQAMRLAKNERGLPFVVAVSFAIWLGLSASTTCFSALIAEGHEIPADARLGGCDSIFTSALRTIAGNTERKPFYDVFYDVNFSFIWVFGVVFGAWYLWRRQSLHSTQKSTAKLNNTYFGRIYFRCKANCIVCLHERLNRVQQLNC